MEPIAINLDFYNNKIIVVNAKRADSQSRYILVTCTEQGKQFKLDKNTMSAFVRCHKPDGFYVFNNAEITDEGKAQIELTQQMLAADGKCKVDLTIIKFTGNTENDSINGITNIIFTDDGNGNVQINTVSNYNDSEDTTTSENDENALPYDVSILSTMTFYINVLDYPMDSTIVVSSNEFDAMMKGVSDMVIAQKETETATEYANNAADNANTAADNANAAADNAENNASLASDAANKAITASLRTYTAVEHAENYASLASDAADNANAAADNANAAAERCNDIVDKTGVVLQEEKGVANGVATLDENIKIRYDQLNVTTSLDKSGTGYLFDASGASELRKLIGVVSDNLNSNFTKNSEFAKLSTSVANLETQIKNLSESIVVVETNDIEAGFSEDIIISFPDGFNSTNTVVLNIEYKKALDGTLDSYAWTNGSAINYQMSDSVGGILIPNFDNQGYVTKIRLILKKI